jgi:deoxyribodipyrimidine photolyase-like uncharacterized protein
VKEVSIVSQDQRFSTLSEEIFIIGDRRYLSDRRYHNKKLLLHRASMEVHHGKTVSRVGGEYFSHQGGKGPEAAMDLIPDRGHDLAKDRNILGMGHPVHRPMSAKPCISPSRNIMRMDVHPRGEWCDIMDSLFWSFVNGHRGTFERRPWMRVRGIRMERLGKGSDVHLEKAEVYKEEPWRR